MINSPKHLHALDVIAVLLFSLLANFIIQLRIDFTTAVDLIELTRLVVLSAGAVLFYTAVVRLKEIADYSRAEYEAETSIEAKAQRSVDDRFRYYINFERKRLRLMFGMAIACCVAFFLVQPIATVLQSRNGPPAGPEVVLEASRR